MTSRCAPKPELPRSMHRPPRPCTPRGSTPGSSPVRSQRSLKEHLDPGTSKGWRRWSPNSSPPYSPTSPVSERRTSSSWQSFDACRSISIWVWTSSAFRPSARSMAWRCPAGTADWTAPAARPLVAYRQRSPLRGVPPATERQPRRSSRSCGATSTANPSPPSTTSPSSTPTSSLRSIAWMRSTANPAGVASRSPSGWVTYG